MVPRAAGLVASAVSMPVRLAGQLLPADAARDVRDGELAAEQAEDAGRSDVFDLHELRELVDDGAELVEDVVEESVDLIEDTFGLHRRVWSHGELAHAQIEVRGIEDPAADGLRRRLAQSARRLKGVDWAEVNAITGRVAVAFDGAESTLTSLLEVIEGLEQSAGARREEHRPSWDTDDRADHPADDEPIHRTIAVVTGDVLSLSWTVVGRVARLVRLPVEFAGLVSMIDTTPWLRDQAELLIGRRGAALVLPLLSAAANGVAQGPMGTLVDLGYQSALLGEYRARRRVWDQREPEFYAVHDDDPIDPPDLPPRPIGLPPGPVERWSSRAGQLGLLGVGGSLAATRDARRATDLLLTSAPKAARLGREGFAALLARTLAYRGVVPLDASAFRRLDRIDTIVLDAEVVLGDRRAVRRVVAPDGAEAGDRVVSAVARMFDGDDPAATVARGRWRLTPLDELDREVVRRARGALTRGKEIRARGGSPLGLVESGALVGIVEVARDLDEGIGAVVDAVRAAGHRLVVADDDGEVARAVGADDRVRGGDALGDEVRRLQADGAGVMVIGRQGHRGLAAADVGLGVVTPTGRPSWGADLILGRELADAATIVAATSVAREVSERSARFAMAGSGLGALVTVTGPRMGAGSRGLAMVNGAAGASLVAGLWAAVKLSHEPRPRVPDRTAWHVLDVDRVLAAAHTDPQHGLTSWEADQRRVVSMPAGGEVSPLEPFLAELANPLNPVLGVGAGLSAAIGSMTDASLVLGLIGVNTAVGGIQRLRADRTVRQLLASDDVQVRVVRDGREQLVREDRVVQGDLLVLGAGDAVPADARVVATDGCEVDESSLTGESLPVTKAAVPSPDVDVADRSSMLYQGTNVVTGSVTAVVVATGEHTEVARSLALAGPPPPTGVELRLEELTRRLLPSALGVAGATGVVGLLRGWALKEITGTTVSLAIASVPEGLPFVATAGQLAGARRLAQHGAVVRNPRTVEALGRVDVLCIDKTGTLTQGRLRLVGVSDGASLTSVGELGTSQRSALAAAQRASEQLEADRAIDELDEIDQAIHRANGHAGRPPGWEQLDELPFEASRGLHAVLGRHDGTTEIIVKGAPEELLGRCSTWGANGRPRPLDDTARRSITDHLDDLARRGHRLLAVARRQVDAAVGQLAEGDLEELRLVGVLALADPVRDTAAEAVRGIERAGVRTIMVTGDHPETAASIARQLGFDLGGAVLVGSDLGSMDDEELADALERTRVVARVAPADKLRIVQALQARDHVVAMTGDGANDAAAIRSAQVGVALGERSAQAARQAADIVVTDDRVETLIHAIAEGRALWGSIREALAVLVGGNLGEIGFTSIASAFSDQAPLHPRQFLLVNLFTDLAPAVAIAVRPPDDVSPETLLREGPDRSLGAALRRDVAIRGTATALGATAAWGAARLTGTQQRAGTVGLAALVGTQLGQTLLAGGWRRPTTLLTVAGSAATFVGAIQTPGVSRFFGSRPLGPLGWWQAGTASVVATLGSEVVSRLAERVDELAGGARPQGGADGDGAAPVRARRRLPADFGAGPQRVLLVGGDTAVGPRLAGELRRAGHQVVWLHPAPHELADELAEDPDVSVVEDTGDDTVRVDLARDRTIAYVLRDAGATDGRADAVAARQAMRTLADQLDRAGVAHVVRLGALFDDAELARLPDEHYASDQATAGLREGRVPVTEVRVGPVLDRGDPLFELLLGVARLPVSIDHPFLTTRVQPVDAGELATWLATLGTDPAAVGRRIDVAGPRALPVSELVGLIRSADARVTLGRLPTRRLPIEVLASMLARVLRCPASVARARLELASADAVLGDEVGAVVRRLATTPEEAIAGLLDMAGRGSAEDREEALLSR